eukprot:3175236-Alexandrium_andersonii.AAC.1
MNAGVARFDRFDSLLGSIGTRCTCHRAPPCPVLRRQRRKHARRIVSLPRTETSGGMRAGHFRTKRPALPALQRKCVRACARARGACACACA